MTIFLGVPVVLFDCSFDRPQSAFSVFLDRLLEQQEPSFSQMADILGLANITEEALVVSRRRHNQFPPDTPFPQVDEQSDGFKELCAIIAKHNAPFQLLLLHHHSAVPEGQAMLGTRIEGLGYWTRPTRISDIDLHKVYGCEISVDAIGCTGEGGMRNALLYSEFREGPPVDIGNIYGNFFTEFTNCLWKHGLANTFGLEFYQGQPRKMIEFSFDTGLLLVKEEELRAELREGTGQFTLRVTTWAITIDNGTVKHQGTKYCLEPPVKGEDHRTIIVPDTEVSDIVEILRDRGYLVTRHMK